MKPIKVLIGTPVRDGSVAISYMTSVMNIFTSFRQERPNVTFNVEFQGGSDIHIVRNIIASNFLEDESYTHLFFLDADTGVTPRLVAKMLDLEQPFVGAVYPSRSLRYSDIRKASRIDGDEALLQSLSLNYVCSDELLTDIHADGRKSFQLRGGFVRARMIGTGSMIVTRNVFETIRGKFPHLTVRGDDTFYRRNGIDRDVTQFFAPEQKDNGEYHSEDESFCVRWVKTGGEIWANVDEPVTHFGVHEYRGKFIDRMKAGLI